MIRVILILSFSFISWAQGATDKEALDQKRQRMVQAFKNNNYSLFLRQASEVLIDNEKDLETLKLLYKYHFKKNQFGMARIIIERSLSYNSKQYEPHFYRGLMALKEKRTEQAVTAFIETLKLNRNYYPALVNLSSIYMQYYDYEKALPLLHRAYKIVDSSKRGIHTNEHFKVANNYAVSLVWARKNNMARKVFRQLRKKDNVSGVILINYGRFLVEVLNDTSEAEKILKEAGFLARGKRAKSAIRELMVQVNNNKRKKKR